MVHRADCIPYIVSIPLCALSYSMARHDTMHTAHPRSLGSLSILANCMGLCLLLKYVHWLPASYASSELFSEPTMRHAFDIFVRNLPFCTISLLRISSCTSKTHVVLKRKYYKWFETSENTVEYIACIFQQNLLPINTNTKLRDASNVELTSPTRIFGRKFGSCADAKYARGMQQLYYARP